MGSAEAAELTKLAETTYRDVNIAFANELARFADRAGVDVDRVIDAANCQPFSHIHRPGVAVGGHCIPVYPRFYLRRRPRGAAARAPRARSTRRCPPTPSSCSRPRSATLAGARVLILGVAYRGDVKETAFSRRVRAARRARRAAAPQPLAADPLYDDDELRALGFDAVGRRRRRRGAILQADHAALRGARARRPARRARRRRRARACSTRGAASRAAGVGAAAHRAAARERSARGASAAPRRARPRARRRRARGARPAACARARRARRRASRSTSTFQPASTVSTHSVVSRSVTHGTPGEVGLLLHAAGVGQHRARARTAAR